MISFKNFILLAAFLPIVASCDKKEEKKVFIQPNLLDTIFSNTFDGIIPCPDCPGIESSIRIYSDSTISRTVFYQDKNELPITKVGTWKLKDSVFTATFDREKLFYRIKNYNQLLRVGSDLKEVQGEFANDYILHKRKPFKPENIEGTYLRGDTLNTHFKLRIKNVKNDTYNLKIAYFNKIDSLTNCNTQLKATLDKNNQLQAKLNDDKSNLRIIFTQKEAHVVVENTVNDSTSNFCKGLQNTIFYGAYKKRSTK